MIRWVSASRASEVVHCTCDELDGPVRLACMEEATVTPVRMVSVARGRKGRLKRCKECRRLRWSLMKVPPTQWMLATDTYGAKHLVESIGEFGPVSICGYLLDPVRSMRHLERGQSRYRPGSDEQYFEPWYPCYACLADVQAKS